jgi:hypothetical protein
MAKYYFYLEKFHLNIVQQNNYYREYLFDNGSIILDAIPYDNLAKKEVRIYANWTDYVNNISYYEKKFINNEHRKELNKSLCSYIITDYFDSLEECYILIGNNFDQDIYTFISGYFDELRIQKNIIRILLELDLVKGNLTEYNVSNWYNEFHLILNNNTNEDVQTKFRFRLDLFNEEYLHSVNNIYFINIIYPCFNKQRKIISEYLNIDKKQNTYYILLAIFIIILIAIYIFYWIPMIRRLNRIIYETKNMLKIIPMHILMADLDIKNLFHISIKK